MTDLMSTEINQLALALSKAQAVIENVDKDKQAFGYKYADLASCLDAVKIPLSSNGLSITQLITQDDTKKQLLVTMLLHESGQWLKSTLSIEGVVMKQCNSLQQLGAGITYARRYALSAIIGLTQEDDDAQSIPKSTAIKKWNKLPDESSEVEKESASRILVKLCREDKIDPTEFATFHRIASNNTESVANGVANFDRLKEEFFNRNKIDYEAILDDEIKI